MKSVVQVSSGEVARMVAVAVLQRPENAGRVVGSVEMEQTGVGTVEMRVVVFDTPGEAQAFLQEVAAVVAPPKAAVLQLVPSAVNPVEGAV